MEGRGGESADVAVELAVFHCAGLRCAIRRESVVQIAAAPALSSPPNLPKPLEGFANRSGTPTPVLRTATLLGRRAAEQASLDGGDARNLLYRHILFVRSGSVVLGLLVDRVLEIRKADGRSILPAGATDSLNGCVEGVVEGDPPIHVLLPARLLLTSERMRLAELVAAEEDRLAAWTG